MKSGNTSVLNGRVTKTTKENEEIQTYLTKLKELVPFMPRNRRLSKLEVIQYVIDYICDLQDALESSPNAVNVMAQAAILGHSTTTINRGGVSTNVNNLHLHNTQRTPLGVLAPNTILTSSCSTQEVNTVPNHVLEKVPTPSDTRPVSV